MTAENWKIGDHDVSLSDLAARYCARQDADAFLTLWALILVLTGTATAAQKFQAIVLARSTLFFAILSGALGLAIFYGCSMTAASEQGLGTDLPAHTYTLLRCLNRDAFGTVVGWIILVVFFVAAITLVVRSRHQRGLVRIAAMVGALLLFVAALGGGTLLLFSFSWCTSQRLF